MNVIKYFRIDCLGIWGLGEGRVLVMEKCNIGYFVCRKKSI